MTLDLIDMGKRAKAAATALARATEAEKNRALELIAASLEACTGTILEANRQDLADGRANGLSNALLDRLDLQKRLTGIIADLRSVIALPDPVGGEYDARTLDNGLRISRRRVPIGVLGVIYEARPNVTVDVAGLALKTGNAAIMRGGKETLRSNMALVDAIQAGLAQAGLPADSVQYIASTDRQYVGQMLKLHQYIDMIIPRGGASLHDFCRENSTIPVIIGGIGICHVYVDPTGKLDDALKIVANAKTQRPSVCNTLDTLLVHESLAAEFLPQVVAHLAPMGVSFHAEPRALAIVDGQTGVQPAGPDDFDTEWMSLVLGLKVVDDLDEAIAHVNAHSLGHSDSIITQDAGHAARFLNEVDSSAVFWNASTRFNDGGQLGLGAEVAVSTQKLHARGPMGLVELTTYKWIVIGDGHIRP
jgi:glutamate-5-semialdehyde dehydrogenase